MCQFIKSGAIASAIASGGMFLFAGATGMHHTFGSIGIASPFEKCRGEMVPLRGFLS